MNTSTKKRKKTAVVWWTIDPMCSRDEHVILLDKLISADKKGAQLFCPTARYERHMHGRIVPLIYLVRYLRTLETEINNSPLVKIQWTMK